MTDISPPSAYRASLEAFISRNTGTHPGLRLAIGIDTTWLIKADAVMPDSVIVIDLDSPTAMRAALEAELVAPDAVFGIGGTCDA